MFQVLAIVKLAAGSSYGEYAPQVAWLPTGSPCPFPLFGCHFLSSPAACCCLLLLFLSCSCCSQRGYASTTTSTAFMFSLIHSPACLLSPLPKTLRVRGQTATLSARAPWLRLTARGLVVTSAGYLSRIHSLHPLPPSHDSHLSVHSRFLPCVPWLLYTFC